MQSFRFIPRGKYISIERDKPQDIKSETGIIEKIGELSDPPQTGVVLEIGDKVQDVRVGDRVAFSRIDGKEMRTGLHSWVTIIAEDEVFGTLTTEEFEDGKESA